MAAIAYHQVAAVVVKKDGAPQTQKKEERRGVFVALRRQFVSNFNSNSKPRTQAQEHQQCGTDSFLEPIASERMEIGKRKASPAEFLT